MNNQTHPPANVGAPTTMHVDVFRAFVEQAKADPAMLHRLAAVFNYQPPFRRSNPIVPLPIRRMKTCGSAWKRDPGSGVIGVEKGPLIPLV
ncbi:hypothetical protein JYA61_03795 [Sphingomonas pseudosanguinis]|uniref:Uncharacterized protein n=1 Tax=Sphingomonas pseudosanguinis TaxID=413712 RepID=A0A7W6F4N4_9SPHN|nr:hypothetical protein [Sphingomonas pseudosanguinis]MBB3881112.1 hypothetical protein [Sphingomonas pseudosanguinis]MBN3535886.1 hypothetical protein [Sphingomonas pseudosanguinis]